jgi:hypothetical protein
MRAALLVVLAACSAASSDPGLGAVLRVDGAQYLPGPQPDQSGGPDVASVANPRTQVTPGEIDKPFAGTLAPGGTAVIIGLDGDPGSWIVTASPPTIQAPDEPSFAVTMSFAPTATLGAASLTLRAVDAAGRVGPPRREPLVFAAPAPPSGMLVISLTWDTEADLDLHVVDPHGVEVWAGNINSYQPTPGQPPDPNAWMTGGILDEDSNANCAIDGRREENVVWAMAPPPGTYVVRVDPSSLCGQPDARWRVQVLAGGAAVAESEGIFVEAETLEPHGLGAGIEAATFVIPAARTEPR